MERQTRREFLKRLGFTVASAGALSLLPGQTVMARSGKARKKRPNIIVIISDDMGYADIGCHGCKDIASPNIIPSLKMASVLPTGTSRARYAAPRGRDWQRADTSSVLGTSSTPARRLGV